MYAAKYRFIMKLLFYLIISNWYLWDNVFYSVKTSFTVTCILLNLLNSSKHCWYHWTHYVSYTCIIHFHLIFPLLKFQNCIPCLFTMPLTLTCIKKMTHMPTSLLISLIQCQIGTFVLTRKKNNVPNMRFHPRAFNLVFIWKKGKTIILIKMLLILCCCFPIFMGENTLGTHRIVLE